MLFVEQGTSYYRANSRGSRRGCKVEGEESDEVIQNERGRNVGGLSLLLSVDCIIHIMQIFGDFLL